MMEQMTQAEEAGYEDEYFPVVPEDAVPQVTAPHDPSEYILSHSPPQPMPIQEPEPTMETIIEQPSKETDDPTASTSPTSSEGQPTGASLSPPSDMSSYRRSEEHSSEERRGVHIPGTHMSPTHPGFLEHVPSSALSPSELQRSSSRRRYPSPTKRRRDRDRSQHQVAEAVFFSYGVSVFFGFQADEEREIMADCEAAGVWQQGLEEDDWEIEEFHYIVRLRRGRVLTFTSMTTMQSRLVSTTTCSVSAAASRPGLANISFQITFAFVQAFACPRNRPIDQAFRVRERDAGIA